MAKQLIRFDWAMKRLLRDKANFAVLEGFLSELLKFDLKIIQIGESEGNQQAETDKFNRVDIVAHTLNGDLILIELQIDSELDYFHRMLYGVSKAISEHLQLGVKYEKLKKVYSVNIVYFQLGQGEDYIYHGKTEFIGVHTHDKLGLSDSQREKFLFERVDEIYPEHFILKINNFNDVAKDGIDEWIYFLKNDEIKDSFNAKGLAKAKEMLDVDKMTEVEKTDYKRHLENERYTDSMLDTAKFEGKIEGINEAKIGVAKNLLLLGLSISDISKATGLSENEINGLK